MTKLINALDGRANYIQISDAASTPALETFAVIAVVIVFLIGLGTLIYWTVRCIKSACRHNQQDQENAAPTCFCLLFSIISGGLALTAVIGIYQINAGLYS